jgi:CubicO group peptidase (beta-lactamase class C family)
VTRRPTPFPRALPDIGYQVDELIEGYGRNQRFSGVVLLAHDGEILVNRGYGMADLAHEVPNEPGTKFNLGPLTMQFTALAIMQLQEEGALSVEDPLSSWFPDHAQWDRVTIHHLLTHSSGIFDFRDLTGYADSVRFETYPTALITYIEDQPLKFEPGTRFSFSNTNYLVLGAVIEQVTGKHYSDYVHDNVFRPAGMADSGFLDTNHVVENLAEGYKWVGTSTLWQADFVDPSWLFAAGGAYATAEDLYRYDRALRSGQLVSQASLETMITPYGDVVMGSYTGPYQEPSQYGYGWYAGTLSGHRFVGHGGSEFGFSTELTRFLDDKLVIIVLSNVEQAPAQEISQELAELVWARSE